MTATVFSYTSSSGRLLVTVNVTQEESAPKHFFLTSSYFMFSEIFLTADEY